MTKNKVLQPPCDYCNFKNRNRATYVLREKGNHRFAGFLSLNNKARFDINKGAYEVEPRPNFCPNCGRKLDDEEKNELSNDQ